MSSQQDNGKLIATAVGAAAAGAGLAVLAMKMVESKTNKKPHEYRPSSQHYGRDLPNVIMNDPSMLMTDPSERSGSITGAGPPGLSRNDSEQLLFPHNHEEKMRRRIATRYTIEEENNLPRNSVTVRVPATSANVGPGCTLLFRSLKATKYSSLRLGVSFPMRRLL
jgi:homoserine kinase